MPAPGLADMVSTFGAAILAAGLVFGLVAYRRRGDPGGLLVCVPFAFGIGVWLLAVADGRPRLLLPFDILLVPSVFVVIAEAVGLPLPLAKRLGVGFRNREWEFDRALSRAIRRIEHALSDDPARSGLVAHLRPHQDERRLVDRLRFLRAPTAEWGNLKDDYADAYEAWVATPAAGDFEELSNRLLALHGESARLRVANRARLEALVAGSLLARRIRRPRD